jgi:phospholipase D1/2
MVGRRRVALDLCGVRHTSISKLATGLSGFIAQKRRTVCVFKLSEVRLGNCYRHGQCRRDVYDAICQAQRLIYIIGWSVFQTIHLLRDDHDDMALGDLLRRKSQEGVRVLLLVWDDPTSRRLRGIKMVRHRP